MIAVEGKRNWALDNWGEEHEKVRSFPQFLPSLLQVLRSAAYHWQVVRKEKSEGVRLRGFLASSKGSSMGDDSKSVASVKSSRSKRFTPSMKEDAQLDREFST